MGEDYQLEILHSDNDIAVVHKPPGAFCVPGKYLRDSLVVRVGKHFRIKDTARMVVHRLDQGTSGVIVFALNEATLKNLHAQFREREGVSKRYVGLVDGVMQGDAGEINVAIRKDMDNPPKQVCVRA